MERVKQLIKKVLSSPPKKEKCNCGCHSCKNVGNPGPVLNENINARVIMSKNMQHHVKNKLPLTETKIPYGTKEYLDLWAEARYLYSRNAIHVNDKDKAILTKTNLGEYGIFEGKKVPLDIFINEETEVGDKEDVKYAQLAGNTPPFLNLLDKIKEDYGLGDVYYEVEEALMDRNLQKVREILKKYELDKEYAYLLNLNEKVKYSMVNSKIKKVYENQPTIAPPKPLIKEPETKPEIKPKRRTLQPDREKTPDAVPHKALMKEDEKELVDKIYARFKKLGK